MVAPEVIGQTEGSRRGSRDEQRTGGESAWTKKAPRTERGGAKKHDPRSRGESSKKSSAEHGEEAPAEEIPAAESLPAASLPSEEELPEDPYACEMARVSTLVQTNAILRLKEMDEDMRYRFTAQQVLELVCVMEEEREEAKVAFDVASEATAQTSKPRLRFPLNHGTCIWFCCAAFVLWLGLLLSSSIVRDTHLESTGVLVTVKGGIPTGVAKAVTWHSLAELQTMEEAVLRRILQCTLVHHGAYISLRVASLLRTPLGDLHIATPDGASLRVHGRLDVGKALHSVTLERPFRGAESVDLSARPFQADSSASVTVGCSFAVMGTAPERPIR
eukprot:TRINITY_DN49515_c0_g1_i1.p1 TRINITY_DN49515_c0_g1~~TRINITY_DN49515_c0_g1_i1.p1  ORF type:complete len:346 (-),score=40.35 TRINITY_DN49515_c0_g1_i1:271-1266(-)